MAHVETLTHAWHLVRANRGSPGIDGVDFQAIERGTGVEALVEDLAQDLKNKTYRAQAIRRVMIPKADGSMRPLGIPTIRDRVAQMAVKLIIEPIFEADFCTNSYGFRPQRSAHDAVDDIANALWSGYTQVIDADLSRYFDSIPHANLLATVAERIVDGGILSLIKQWLKSPVVEQSEPGVYRNVGGGKANSQGTPQGGVISPLLSNCYLHVLDRIWQRRNLKGKLQAHLVRYADDFVVLCRGDVQEPLEVVRHILERLGLKLNEAKTHVVDAKQTHFKFLGFSIRMSRGMRTGKPYPNVCPSEAAMKKIKAKLTAQTGRNLTAIPLAEVVGAMNRSLRGWVNYFHRRNSSQSMEKVKLHAEQSLRTHLMKRHKVKGRRVGEGRFPSVKLYAQHGLYKVPTAAAWRSAHA